MKIHIAPISILYTEISVTVFTVRLLLLAGCPAGAATVEGVTPQKIAKTEGFKDCMKELKKLTSFQDKVAKGSKPKGFSEQWCIQVSICDTRYFE